MERRPQHDHVVLRPRGTQCGDPVGIGDRDRGPTVNRHLEQLSQQWVEVPDPPSVGREERLAGKQRARDRPRVELVQPAHVDHPARARGSAAPEIGDRATVGRDRNRLRECRLELLARLEREGKVRWQSDVRRGRAEPEPCHGGQRRHSDGEVNRAHRTAPSRLHVGSARSGASHTGTGTASDIFRALPRVERGAKRRRARPPVGRQLRQRLHHRALDRHRHGVAHHTRRGRLLAHDLGDDRLHRGAGERRLAHEHFVQHGAEGIDVAAGIDGPLAHRLLGRHVLRRAEREAGLRHASAARALHREGDAKVGHQRVAAVEEDVLRLDVAVDDALRVRVGKRIGHLVRNAHGVVNRQLLVAHQAIAQRLAVNERHHVEQEAARRAGVMQRQDVRMLQVRGGGDLGEEALGTQRRREVGVQHLDRDLPVVLDVGGEIDGRHAAGAEFAVERVAAGEGGGEISAGVTHVGLPIVGAARIEASVTTKADDKARLGRGNSRARLRVSGRTGLPARHLELGEYGPELRNGSQLARVVPVQ